MGARTFIKSLGLGISLPTDNVLENWRQQLKCIDLVTETIEDEI